MNLKRAFLFYFPPQDCAVADELKPNSRRRDQNKTHLCPPIICHHCELWFLPRSISVSHSKFSTICHSVLIIVPSTTRSCTIDDDSRTRQKDVSIIDISHNTEKKMGFVDPGSHVGDGSAVAATQLPNVSHRHTHANHPH